MSNNFSHKIKILNSKSILNYSTSSPASPVKPLNSVHPTYSTYATSDSLTSFIKSIRSLKFTLWYYAHGASTFINDTSKKTFSFGFYYIRGLVVILFIDACLTDDEPL
jgi:hypothetical protein